MKTSHGQRCRNAKLEDSNGEPVRESTAELRRPLPRTWHYRCARIHSATKQIVMAIQSESISCNLNHSNRCKREGLELEAGARDPLRKPTGRYCRIPRSAS